MSYELPYFPTFIDNLRIWYAEKYSSEKKLKAAFDRKIDRITRYLEKEFKPIYEKYTGMDYTSSEKIPKIIWIMWWQGVTDLPAIPQKCIEAIRRQAPEFEVRIVSEDNHSKYIDLSDVIGYRSEKTFGKERISMQYLSDIVRSRLLAKHGGFWIDATMLVTNRRVFDTAASLSFFTIRLKECLDNKLLFSPGHGQFCESFWGTAADNPLFSYINDCMTYHASLHKTPWDYFIIEYSIVIGMKHVPFIRKMIEDVPFSNIRLYWLQNHAAEQYDEGIWKGITDSTDVFKLDWRMRLDPDSNMAFLRKILN